MRKRTLAPSEDVVRYQARDMPAPTYDLDRKPPGLLSSILVPALAAAIMGGSIVLIQRVGAWLLR